MRTFRDIDGTAWTVWPVFPSVSIDGTSAPGSLLSDDAAGGWLTFESPQGKRRFYQPPPELDELTHAELALLCRHAVAVIPAPS
jgi:hypothetical protein